MGSKAPYPLFTDGTNIYTTFDGGLTYVTITSGGGGTIHTSAPLSGDGSVGTPATIAAGAVPLTALAAEAANTFVANGTGGSASPTAITPAAAAALLPAATPSAAGVAVAGTVAPIQAALLTDASPTVSPGTDAASQYTLPAATLTANRTLTLGTGGSPATNLVVQIIRRDLTAHTFAIVNGGGGGGTLLTFASGPATAQGASFYYDGTNWNFLNFFYVA